MDIHLLKPARAWAQLATDFALGCKQVLAGDNGRGEWTTYQYRTAHPILRWLPTKLAEWIGDNYGPDLGIAPKGNADGWTVGELNTILETTLSLVQRVICAPLDALSGSQQYLMDGRRHAVIPLICPNTGSEERIFRYLQFIYEFIS